MDCVYQEKCSGLGLGQTQFETRPDPVMGQLYGPLNKNQSFYGIFCSSFTICHHKFLSSGTRSTTFNLASFLSFFFSQFSLPFQSSLAHCNFLSLLCDNNFNRSFLQFFIYIYIYNSSSFQFTFVEFIVLPSCFTFMFYLVLFLCLFKAFNLSNIILFIIKFNILF